MRVLHILNELRYSGMEVMLSEAGPYFQSRGYESHILSTGDVLGDYAPILASRGFCLHHIAFRRDLRFLFKVFLFLVEGKFAVVHIHPERSFFWYAVLAKLSGARVIIRSVLDVFLFEGWLRWKRSLQRRLAGRMLGVIFWSIGESVLAVERERFDNKSILIRSWTNFEHFVPPSADERKEARRLFNISPSDFAIVTVGTCNEKKRHMDVFRTIRAIKLGHPDASVVFLHRGTGPDTEAEISAAETMGIADRCRFVGYLDDVRSLLCAADAFVMTSYNEGLGSVIFEAMSVGLPVILYNGYGMKDLLQNQRGGLLIEPNEAALQQAVIELAADPITAKRMGEEARDEILRAYSIRESMRRFSVLYEGKPFNFDAWQTQQNPDYAAL